MAGPPPRRSAAPARPSRPLERRQRGEGPHPLQVGLAPRRARRLLPAGNLRLRLPPPPAHQKCARDCDPDRPRPSIFPHPLPCLDSDETGRNPYAENAAHPLVAEAVVADVHHLGRTVVAVTPGFRRAARLLRQLLTESAVIAALGGIGGLVATAYALDLLVSLMPADVPRLAQIGVNQRVLAFTAGLVLTALAFGCAPRRPDTPAGRERPPHPRTARRRHPGPAAAAPDAGGGRGRPCPGAAGRRGPAPAELRAAGQPFAPRNTAVLQVFHYGDGGAEATPNFSARRSPAFALSPASPPPAPCRDSRSVSPTCRRRAP